MYIYSRRQKKRSVSVPVPFRSVVLVMNGQKKWRAVLPVLPVPFRPFCPFCLLILALAHAQMNPEILRIDVHARGAVNTRPA